MKRFQDALEGHLNKQLEKINLEVRELKEALKTKQKEREELGVNMYGLQQELAKQQMTLEKYHDQCGELRKQRHQSEEQLADVRSMYKQTQQNINQQQKEGWYHAEMKFSGSWGIQDVQRNVHSTIKCVSHG